MKVTGQGIASGKIILMGEHSVVYGEPAIALPFSAAQITLQMEPAEIARIDSVYFQGKLAAAPLALKSIQALLQALQLHFVDSATFCLHIESTIPAERGMGSSAAVAVALTRAYFDYQKKILTNEELLHFVNLSERIAHGNPSGIDAAATSGVNPVYFVKGKEITDFPLNIDAYLIVADTGIKGQTRATVADVATLFEKNRRGTAQQITGLGELAKRAKRAIIENDAPLLGGLMTAAHQLLKGLTVSNAKLDLLTDTAISNGALGAKLTGGGRGGCLISLAQDHETAQRIASAQEAAGAAKTWIQGLGVFKE